MSLVGVPEVWFRAHISPAHSENTNFFGAIEADIDAELAQLGPTGYRPPRVRDTLF
ncbi:hypothetical protein ACFXPS_25105 [Nocardia sp. NPDC059091]|uniref:hypothetical protein n=1 Tax=unclassified Nocardia TaxID=2637762 RepID=UPI00368F833C